MPVKTDDIAREVGRPPASLLEKQAWQMWIDDALLMVDARCTETGVPRASINARLVDYVVRISVSEHVKHPDNATQVTGTVSVDDGSSTTSKTYRSGSGHVRISDEFWSMLGLSGSDGMAFTIQTIPLGGQVHSILCALNFGALYCSCGSELNNGAYPLYEMGTGIDEDWTISR